MSFEFINGVTPNPIKEKPVVKNNKPKYDPNNPSKDMDIALQNLRKNIILKYKKWGGFNPDKFDISFKYCFTFFALVFLSSFSLFLLSSFSNLINSFFISFYSFFRF